MLVNLKKKNKNKTGNVINTRRGFILTGNLTIYGV
jgi:hypothetical protein